jgi:hypothetical protein
VVFLDDIHWNPLACLLDPIRDNYLEQNKTDEIDRYYNMKDSDDNVIAVFPKSQ